MKFCEDTIKWTDLIDIFQNLYNKSQDINNVSVLQGIALARELRNDIDAFLSMLSEITLKALICQVLSEYDLDSEIEEIEKVVETLFTSFDTLDATLSQINKGELQSLEDIESLITPYLDDFGSIKEEIESSIDQRLITVFQPLIELGATNSNIINALEDVEYETSPKDYIIAVFIAITEQTLNNID